MTADIKRRLTSAVCAAAIFFSSFGSSLAEAVGADEEAQPEDKELTYQSIELYPNGEDAEQVITLDGLMPEGAQAEAVDVSSDYEGIAAYNITIMDGSDEYQPVDGEPIFVEIADPIISEDMSLTLWHISDGGERTEITDFILEDGKLSFYAEGFSVYEIVKNEAIERDGFFDSLAEQGEDGFYAPFIVGPTPDPKNGPYYFTSRTVPNVRDAGRTGIDITAKQSSAPANAVKLYFEREPGTVNKFYIYIKDESGNRQYIHMFRESGFKSGRSALDYVSEDERTLFTLDRNENNQVRLYATLPDKKNYYWVRNTNDNIIALVGYASSTDTTLVWLTFDDLIVKDDSLGFDGKTYGLMNFTGGTHGYALMAGEDNVHSLVELVTHQSQSVNSVTLYVDEGSEVTKWTFHSAGGDKYTLSGTAEGVTKYLAISGDTVTITDLPEEAAQFKVTTDDAGRIQLSYNGKYVSFVSGDDGEYNSDKFLMTAQSTANTWLYLLGTAKLGDEDRVVYSADRISVSKAQNGQRVIVYTRIWNEDTLKYDMYAIDHDGTLYPCYASGGKILWLGDGTGSLEWIFTEYYEEVSKEPNYYYELYNPYSGKYLAPQLLGGQTLSDDTIGINMPGRRNGEFFTKIIAWDDSYYSYIGLQPNEDKTKLVPCSQLVSFPFYFATLEALNLSDSLHEVPTVDNNEHGITIKMQDFGSRSEMSGFLGSDKGGAVKTTVNGLLSSSLGSDGYPTVSSGKSLKELFDDTTVVNHLFINSIYESSGYFEFDSCQNFATLCNDDGTKKAPYNYKDADGNEIPTVDFTVYRELGTTDNNTGSSSYTRKHGQFLPYDNIFGKTLSVHRNTYSSLTTVTGSEGELPETDPRKYETMYNVGNNSDSNSKPNYYNGMELSASFVQTVSGLDAWGHDIIFEFTGDDDFWLYVDGELIIDLGGIHSALEGNVNFRTGNVYVNGTSTTLIDIFRNNYTARGMSEDEINTKLAEIFDQNSSGQYIFKDYTTHTMKIFYMERGAGASNLHMRFNLASVTPGHVVISKSLLGDGADEIDTDFVEYPFQIYYTPEGEDGKPLPERLLANDDEHIRVTYQNSNQPVTFVQSYRPPGVSAEDAYESIYFINPTKNAEISFPDDTISYRIVECAVDTSVYSTVKINGEAVPDDRVEIKGNLKSYSSEAGTAEKKPSISFDNYVNSNVVKDLFIQKKLYDENNNEVDAGDDPTTFNFRLYISSVNVPENEIPAANMYSYYVLSPDKYICKNDPATGSFVKTTIEYDRAAIEALPELSQNGEPAKDNCVFTTSGFGAISRIPAGYIICVPGLPAGTVFKVTEDVIPGYGLKENEEYVRVLGDFKNEQGVVQPIVSYYDHYSGDNTEPDGTNVGVVRVEEHARMEVHNQKGYSLTAKKKWSDLDITTGHDTIYTAVYVDGELLEDSVRQIASPSTQAYYFWTSLKKNTDGSERTNLDGYVVREVELGGDITVSSDGKVTGYGSLTVKDTGDSLTLNATRTASATPEGENRDKPYDYVVSYEQGEFDGSSRTDIITNTREGGIAIRLFKWASEIPLSGGTFTLKNSSGATLGSFTSDREGIVNILYNFERNELYTLTQDSAVKGYVGLQKKLKFRINDDESASLFYNDGTTPWGTADSTDNGWAGWKPGVNGITAFIDIYNKPFNFKIVKTDSADPELKLGSAHFALYKQANTTINGYMKYQFPMTGFEDMVTVNGEVDVCGGSSGRVINPGKEGSVYFLEEVKAPFNYNKLEDDLVFRISALGVPSLISDSYNGQLVELDDAYVYTLSVPNTKKDDTLNFLTIEKKVAGSFGSRSKEFSFTVEVSGAVEGEGLAWAKNGEEQSAMPLTGGDFTLKHDDKVEIVLPAGVTVTVREDSDGYTPSYKLGGEAAQSGNSVTFEFTGSTELVFTNSLNGEVPTGLDSTVRTSLILIAAPAALIGFVMYRRRRRRTA